MGNQQRNPHEHSGSGRKQIRYAVIGAGHIAQTAVLPAFHNARENSCLVAILSGDANKREQLAKRYDVALTGDYDDIERIIQQGQVDAVYIATPNNQHCEQAVRAARAGAHVLCEKPMAVTVAECEQMIRAAQDNQVRLMIGYRLHFEEANLRAIDLVKSGHIGAPKVFTSVFTQVVRAGDIRTKAELGGGAMLDLGVYPINAARNLFRDEPLEVMALCPPADDPKQTGVDETTAVLLRFSGGRVAQLTVSQGAAAVSSYRILGTEGDLHVEPAYLYNVPIRHTLTMKGQTTHSTYDKRDQFGPELVYFSRCILEGREPEPSGEEGMFDVRVVNAIAESIRTGKAVSLPPAMRTQQRPDLRQAIHKPAIKEPKPIDVQAPALR